MCIIKIENENHKVVATKKVKNKPFHLAKQNGLFFYLLKIITNAIIKAIATVVTPTKPKNSRYIICNNTISIAPPRFPTEDTVKFKGGNSLCLSHFLVLECTIF